MFILYTMDDFNAIYKEFSEETRRYHYIIRKVNVIVCYEKVSFVLHRSASSNQDSNNSGHDITDICVLKMPLNPAPEPQ